MANFPIINNLRIVPRDTDYLDRKVGSRGEIYFDINANTLRLYTGSNENTGGLPLARADLSNISDADFLTKATAAGVGGGGGGGGSAEFSFSADDSTIQTVPAGNSVKFLGGNGISTNSNADELSITNDANVFSTISVAGQNDVVADSLTDTLTLVAGTNVTITTDDTTDTITISASPGGGGGLSALVEDTDPTLSADLDAGGFKITQLATPTADADATTKAYVDSQLDVANNYLPAMTKLVVDNVGATAYTFDQYSGDNPTIFVINGTTVAFDLSAIEGHPFEIQTPAGLPYNTGLVHVAPDGTVSSGAAAQGKTSGVLYWKIPTDISGGYRYQCQNHAGMVGSLTIKDISLI